MPDEPYIVDLDNDDGRPPRGSRLFSWDRAIRLTDPEFDKERRTEVEYEFAGRTFRARPAERWPTTWEGLPPEPPANQTAGVGFIPSEAQVFALANIAQTGNQYPRPAHIPSVSVVPDIVIDREADAQAFTPDHIASAVAMHAPTLTSGNITIVPAHVPSAEVTDLDPTITTGLVSFTLDAIASEESVPPLANVEITYPAQTVTLDAIAAGDTARSVGITVGAVTVSLDAIASTTSVPAIVASVGAAFVTPAHIASLQTMHAPTVEVAAAPGITYVGGATGTDSVTMPSHQAGDLIIAFAFRSASTTIPTVPSGWITPSNSSVQNSGRAARVAWKIAASGAETSGTWTNAEGLVVHVYRGVSNRAPINGLISFGFGGGTSPQYNALEHFVRNDSTSWVVGFYGHSMTDGTPTVAPSGMTNRTGAARTNCKIGGHDTNAATNSWTTASGDLGGTSGSYISAVIELYEDYSVGSNICTNGEFTTDTSGWSLGSGWSRYTSGASTNPHLGNTGSSYATWTTGVAQNTIYEMSWISYSDVGQINVVNNSYGAQYNQGLTRTGGVRNYTLIRTGTVQNLQFQGGGGYRIDDIEMRAVTA